MHSVPDMPRVACLATASVAIRSERPARGAKGTASRFIPRAGI
jgi:hypothetical protein